MMDLSRRHISTRHFGPLFDFEHLPFHLQGISEQFHDLAENLIDGLPDGPELSACLRKLVEAKDCAVRAAVLVHSVAPVDLGPDVVGEPGPGITTREA